MMRVGLWGALTIAAFGSIAGAACVPGDAAPPDRGVVVAGPPPAPRNEAPPPSPQSGQLAWVAGYWHWVGDRYVWVPGHWEQPPQGARRWRPPHYSFHDGVYSYEAGGWIQR